MSMLGKKYRGTYDEEDRNLTTTEWSKVLPCSKATVSKYICLVRVKKNSKGKKLYSDDEIMPEVIKMVEVMGAVGVTHRSKSPDKAEAVPRENHGEIIRRWLSMSWGNSTASRR